MNLLKEAAVDYVSLIKDKEVPIARKIAVTWIIGAAASVVATVLWILFLLGGFVSLGILGAFVVTFWAVWYIENK